MLGWVGQGGAVLWYAGWGGGLCAGDSDVGLNGILADHLPDQPGEAWQSTPLSTTITNLFTMHLCKRSPGLQKTHSKR